MGEDEGDAGGGGVHLGRGVVCEPALRVLGQFANLLRGDGLQRGRDARGGFVEADLAVEIQPVRQGHLVKQHVLRRQFAAVGQTVPGRVAGVHGLVQPLHDVRDPGGMDNTILGLEPVDENLQPRQVRRFNDAARLAAGQRKFNHIGADQVFRREIRVLAEGSAFVKPLDISILDLEGWNHRRDQYDQGADAPQQLAAVDRHEVAEQTHGGGLGMKGMDGIETLRRIRARDIDARVVMLTVSDNEEDVVAALQAGADGYLLKDMEPEEILSQLAEAAAGRIAISPGLVAILAHALRESGKPRDISSASLTRREDEILQLISQGLSNKLIGRELDITDGTVKVHVKNLLKKLQLRSRVEAAVWMIEHRGSGS